MNIRRTQNKLGPRLAIIFVAALMTLGVAAYAAEYNFYEQADKKGCASIITERGQEECARVQKTKDDACNVSVECDVEKQKRTIAKYKEAKERLERGQVNDSDKERLKQLIRDLKVDLDTRKESARRGILIAQECVTARSNVQKWFIETAIPLTERTRDDALTLRRDLLDKLTETQKKQTDAKTKRDSKPGDLNARGNYDRATKDMRDAEKALEQFNNKYGKDVERYAAKLIDHYKAENELHKDYLKQANQHLEKCKTLEGMSY